MEPIQNNSAYHFAMSKIEAFIEKGFDQLSVEETIELEQLSLNVENYESQKYSMPIKATIPEMLQDLMFEQQINKTELSRRLGISNSALSEILSGKKKINLSIARKLHDKLNFDGNVILEMNL
jgi:HTH-type transcriptional regulator/antitoxin HigA